MMDMCLQWGAFLGVFVLALWVHQIGDNLIERLTKRKK